VARQDHRRLARLRILAHQRCAVIERRRHRLHLRILGGELRATAPWRSASSQFAVQHRHLGQRDAALEILGILLDQAQELAVGLAQVAPRSRISRA
jgi:hypothetical protein